MVLNSGVKEDPYEHKRIRKHKHEGTEINNYRNNSDDVQIVQKGIR